MEVYNGTIAITYKELTGGENALVKENTLNSWVRRGRAFYVRKGYGQGVEALIEYSTLPAHVKSEIVSRYGDPEQLRKEVEERYSLPFDDAAYRYYRYEYIYIKNDREVRLSESLVDEYTLNARVIQALIRKQRELQTMRNRMKNGMGNLWEIVAQYSETLKEQYGHTLPASASRLRLKVKAYESKGYDSLISGRLGNENTAVITGDAAEYIISLKRSRIPAYTHQQMFDKYNAVCELNGWKQLKSVQSMVGYLYQPHVRRLWADIVLGENVVHSEIGYKFTTQAPSCRDAMWASDGTRLNLYYRAVGADGRERLATADVYVIIDVYSGAMLGYEIGNEAKSEVQYKAFRKAVLFAEHRPYELVLDNQAGQKKLETQGFLKRIAHNVHFKTPYRKQANPIEAIFGQFQQQVLHKHFYFTGQNITAKGAETRPNYEFIQANIDRVPDLKGLKEVYEQETQEWNNSKHPVTGLSRIETYRMSVNDQLTKCRLEDYVEMFWLEAKHPVTFTSSGLTLTIDGRKYMYDVYAESGLVDHEWRSHYLMQRFVVKYDPCDPARICLYEMDANGDRRFCTFAQEMKKVHRAMQDQGTEDLALIYGNLREDRKQRMERIITGRAIDLKWGNVGNHPRVPTFSAEENEEINAEARRRAGVDYIVASHRDPLAARTNKINIELAQVAKKVSSTDWRTVLDGIDESQDDDLLRRVYAKM